MKAHCIRFFYLIDVWNVLLIADVLTQIIQNYHKNNYKGVL